jgi:hypothetical protein
MILLIRVLWAFAVFWHTLAFAAGSVNVLFAYRAVFGGRREASWSQVIHAAEWHLWVSGLAIVGLGISLSGWETYLADPKLWTKALLVTVWLFSTLVMRHMAIDRLRAGKRSLMLWACSISAACWIYGAFVGVAKTLANGALPFAALAGGFLLTILGCLMATMYYENVHTRAALGE